MTTLLRVLPTLWMIYAIGWISAGLSYFRAISGIGGPGTGGAVVVIPYAIGCIAFGGLSALLVFPFATGRRTIMVGLSIVGLVAMAVAIPLGIFTFIYIALVFDAGDYLGGLAYVSSPLLYVMTLVAVAGGRKAESPRSRIFVAGLVMIAALWAQSRVERPPAAPTVDAER